MSQDTSDFVRGWLRGTFVGVTALVVSIVLRTVLLAYGFDPDAATLAMIGLFSVLVLAGAPL